MAWTKPAQAVPNQAVTAALWNTQVADNMTFLLERIEALEAQRQRDAERPTGVLATVAGLAAASGAATAKTTRRGFLGLNLWRR